MVARSLGRLTHAVQAHDRHRARSARLLDPRGVEPMSGELTRAKRWLIGALSVGLVVFTGVLVKTHIQPYNITSVLAENDPVRVAYQAHLAKYNDENDIYLLLESPTPI